MRSSGSNPIQTKNEKKKKSKEKTKEVKTKNKHKDAKKKKAPHDDQARKRARHDDEAPRWRRRKKGGALLPSAPNAAANNPVQPSQPSAAAQHDEQCSTTCFYTMSVRLLSGKLQQLSVKPDTTILAIKVQLEKELNPPEFHKVSLYVGETELSEGSISEVALSEDTEVQAVMRACIEKPVKVIEELLEWLYNDAEQCPIISPKIAKAASFLTGLQFEDGFQAHVCKAAFALIELPRWFRHHPRWYLAKRRLKRHFLPTIIELAMWGCHLLGKYGNDSGEAFLGDFIEDIDLTVADEAQLMWLIGKEPNTFNNLRVAAQNALDKIRARIGIQCNS